MWRLAFVTLVAAFPRNLAGVSTGQDRILLHSNDGAYCHVPEKRGVLRRCYALSTKALKDSPSRMTIHQCEPC